MPSPNKIFELPSEKLDILDFLENRRSNLAKVMTEPGPNEAQIKELLTIAARVPDHRKLTPWRFMLFQGQARADIGQHIASAFMKANPEASADRAIFEGQRFIRAPLVVGVISSPKKCPRGTPEWEQILSAGVVCYNLCLAVQASGFGAQWLTEWYSYDKAICSVLGLGETEKVAGFIYIGTPSDPPKERARPDLEPLISSWESSLAKASS